MSIKEIKQIKETGKFVWGKPIKWFEFGNYSILKYQPDGDSNDDETIDMECVALSKGFDIEINPMISEPKNLLTMLKDNEHNVAKEILKNKIILFGAEKFWELILEAIK